MDKKAIFINTASQVTVRFVTLAFALISLKLLTNYLGPAGIGNYNTITTYVNFFIVLADLGLFAITVREISKNSESEKKILSNVFSIRLVTAFIASLLAILIVFFTKYSIDIKIGVLVASGFIFFNLLSSVYDVVLQCRLKMQFSALAELLSKLVALVALYIIIKNSGSFLAIVSTITITGLIIFLLKWLFSIKFISFWPKYDKKIASWIFNLSWPIGIVFIVNNLYFKLDTLMLFAIKGAAAVGIYSVAYKVLETTVFIGSYFASALKPTISKEIVNNKEALARIIQKSFNVMLICALPITIICIAFAKDIILFLSNYDFVPGVPALIILSIALPFIYCDTLLGEILIAKDSRKLLVKISIFIILFNLITNLYAIPRFSFLGAACTTLLSEIVLLGINYHYTRRIINYHFNFVAITKILIISITTLLLAFLIRDINISFLILIVASLIFYGSFAYLLRLINYQTFRELIK